MIHEPIDHAYFNWLCAKVVSVTAPNPFYFTLLRELHNTEFVYVLQRDEDRALDGLELRRNFLVQTGYEEDPDWRNLGCSVLEMLVAFSHRCWFMSEIDSKVWFWEFMHNLGLDEMSDSTNPDPNRIADILYRFVWRTYKFHGQGGIFPMPHTRNDQRKVELWYQFSEYLEATDRLIT